MKNHRRTILQCFVMLTLVGVAPLITPKANAQAKYNLPKSGSEMLAAEHDDHNEEAITIASLAGPWQMTLIGYTGCGMTTMLVTFTLNEYGLSSTTIKGHTSDPATT